MTNDYTRQWFEVFLETMPSEWTAGEVDGVCRRLPLPAFGRVLDICCGPGRHSKRLADAGYEITGIDRDADAIRHAQALVPAGEFLTLDQRDLAHMSGPFDAAVILWQSFGFFEPADNDRVLADIASLLRPQGRLLLDLFHPGFFETRQGRTTSVRDPRCVGITNSLDGPRLTSRIEYVDGAVESMNWELFTPDEISARAARLGFRELERCCWWDETRKPRPDERRFQIVLERT
jgi:SAM-dependent methyltransferase